MAFEQHIVDQVQAANDIVEIINQYVPLKRSGRNFKARCPFHQEKTASFMVHPEKQIFHCFGCGAGGSVFSFLMRYENSSFPEALRRLAERAHIQLPESASNVRQGPSDSEKLYEIYRHAADFYHAQFLDPVKGKAAQDYFFKKRGFDLALAKEFQVGWAEDNWRGLFDYLSKKGFPDTLLLKTSLIHRSPKGNFYDVFRGRLLFPIRNLQGKVVAFGGRMLTDGEGPKYLNSPENPIFQKRRELFGLDLAKRFIDRDKPQLLVVEGYMDFLGLYQAGFKTAVATLGTSLTEDHVQLLKRFAEEAVVVYDGDKAGEAASLRGLEVFLEGGMNVKLIRLPAGYDPDDFVRKEGAEAFRKLLSTAYDFFDYKLEVLLGRFNRWDSLGLMRITNEFMETFTKVQNPVLLDRYLKRLAASLGVEENSLRIELGKLKKKTQSPARNSVAENKTARPRLEISDEVLLLSLITDNVSLREVAFRELEEEDFQEPPLRAVFGMLIGMDHEGQKISWPTILNRLDQEIIKQRLVAASSLEWSEESDRVKAFNDCLAKMKRKDVDRRLGDLRRSIARAERDGDEAGLSRFVKEYQDLLRQSR